MTDTVRTPSVGVLTLSGAAPWIYPMDLIPVAGALVFTGYAEFDIEHDYRTPGTGELVFTFVEPGAYQLIEAALTPGRHNGFRTAAVTTEQWIHQGRCHVYGIFPEAATAGTVTLRDTYGPGGLLASYTLAASAPQAGVILGPGIFFGRGLSVQLSNASDRVLIAWEAV